jgi:toxin-antitoxin system PIN domain toxin
VWLALALSKHELHMAAGEWFAKQSGRGTVLFCRASQQSLLRLLTTEKLMALYDLPPLTNAAAWDFYKGMLADPRLAWAAEPRGLEAHWQTLAARGRPSPKLWMDAYLAAFAMAGGHRLITSDKAFAQFQDLQAVVLTKK